MFEGKLQASIAKTSARKGNTGCRTVLFNFFCNFDPDIGFMSKRMDVAGGKVRGFIVSPLSKVHITRA
jgi:hypothetical protein